MFGGICLNLETVDLIVSTCTTMEGLPTTQDELDTVSRAFFDASMNTESLPSELGIGIWGGIF